MTQSETYSRNPAPPPSSPAASFILAGMAARGRGLGWDAGAVRAVSPALPTAAAKPVTFPLAELPVGGTQADHLRRQRRRWCCARRRASAAFSLVCTHLGCMVQWQEGDQEFYCPCHDGRFDQFGEVLAGPPPVPLEQIAVRVEGETVMVGERRDRW